MDIRRSRFRFLVKRECVDIGVPLLLLILVTAGLVVCTVYVVIERILG